MLLLYPPCVRSTEPPLGIARLSGYLKANGINAETIDLNQGAFAHLIHSDTIEIDKKTSSVWSLGSLKRRVYNYSCLTNNKAYENFDRYKRTVLDLNKALTELSKPFGVSVTLANYEDNKLSPLKYEDLLSSAQNYKANIFYNYFSLTLKEKLSQVKNPVIGISINFLSQALCAFALIGYIKDTLPSATIILGGGLMTSWIKQEKLALDENFKSLVSKIIPEKGEEQLLNYILENLYRENIYREKQEAFVIKSKSAAPDFSDFKNNAYFSKKKIIPYNLSSGCPWKKCTFCPEKAENNVYTSMTNQKIYEELCILKEEYKPSLFHFTDSEISPLHFNGLIENPIHTNWYGFARFSKELTSLDYCKKLAKAGCVLLQLGLESGNQKVLDAMGKGTNLEEIKIILNNLYEAKISAFLYVLFGTPHENYAEAQDTKNFVSEYSSKITFMNTAIFNLPNTSELAKEYATQEFYSGDLSLYTDFTHPSAWNREAIRIFLKKEFESEPNIKKIIQRNPPIFTSNHAAYFSSLS